MITARIPYNAFGRKEDAGAPGAPKAIPKRKLAPKLQPRPPAGPASRPKLQPRPPAGPPPQAALLRRGGAAARLAQAPGPPQVQAPSFMGACARKRRRELLGEDAPRESGGSFPKLLRIGPDELRGEPPALQPAPRRPRPPSTPPPGHLLPADAAPPGNVPGPIKPLRSERPRVVAPRDAPPRPAPPRASRPRPVAPAPRQPAPARPAPAAVAKRLTLREEGALVEEFPDLPDAGLALAVPYGGDFPPATLLSGSREILGWLLGGNAAGQISLLDDPHWKQYTEVTAAWSEAGGEELSLCIAVCGSRAAWGAGFGGRWKTREQAAQLALAAALAPEVPDEIPGVLDRYPDFAALLDAASSDAPPPTPGGSVASRTQRRRELRRKAAKARAEVMTEKEPEAEEPDQEPCGLEAEEAEPEACEGDTAEEEPEAAGETEDGVLPSLPRDLPIWISLPEEEPMPPALDGLPGEALALCSDGDGQGLYSCGEQALRRLLGDDGPEIEYHDDAKWEDFAAVGAALKEVAEKEECLCVAVCPELSVWAVGVGMRSRNRQLAAKVALAATLALQAAEGDGAPDFEDLPVFDGFVEEVRAQALGEQEGERMALRGM